MTGFGIRTDEVSAAEAHRLITDGHQVVDVRRDDEFAAGHVSGAVHLPLHLLPARVDELPTSSPWLAICRSGGRSMQATAFLRSRGLVVRNVAGGMVAWLDAGLPIRDLQGNPGGVL